jgi:hypothetical protein
VTYVIGGPRVELLGHFLSSTGDGLFIEARDLGEETDAAVSDFVSFDGGIPASLLLVQATEQ